MKTRVKLLPLLALVLIFAAVVILPQVIEAKRDKAVASNESQVVVAQEPQKDDRPVKVGQSVRNDTSIPLREMKQKPMEFRPDREANENPKVPHKHKDEPDRVVQREVAAPNIINPNIPAPVTTFEGIGFPGVACNCAPPDTNGDVGPTQYVQIVNEVILAGILLKLGTYGFYRFNLPMFPGASKDQHFFGSFGVRSVIVFLAIISILYGALAAMYFVVKKDGDVKKLVAYSSVSSMGMVMLGLFALNPNGINGGVMQMINHGIYSGALFLLVGIIYERRHTRNVAEFGGLSHVMPGYAAVFLAMVMTAIGLPLLAVFISEFLALRGAFEANPVWAAWAALGIILNAGYFLWLYQRMFFGTIDNPKNEKLTDLNGREWAYMTPLLILSLWIGVYPKPFIAFIEQPVNAVVKQVRPEYQIPGQVSTPPPERAQK